MSEQVVIVGAGPTGLALALALRQGGLDPLVVDARSEGAAGRDPRILALAPGTRQTLARMGVWNALPSTPIETIHISQKGGFGRTCLQARDYGMAALGHVAEAGALARALERGCREAGVRLRYEVSVGEVRTQGASLHLPWQTAAGETGAEQAQLVCWAEGRIVDAPDVVKQDYGQHGVITVVKTQEGPGRVAYERFTPDGPLAILPCGEGYAVVFTASPGDAQALLDLDDAAFLRQLQSQFGERLHFISAEPRLAYPLILRYRTEPVGARQVWVGNSAQSLHPVGGQGFNLALRDAWHLAEQLLRQTERADLGAAAVLAGYASRRALDRRGTIGFTDLLVRVFSNEQPMLQALRGAGLLLLDVCPTARDFVAKRMMYGARAWP